MTAATPAQEVRARVAAWSVPGYRQVVRAWAFTNVADSALYLMVAVWVKEISGSDRAAVLVFAMLGLPSLLAPVLGALTDRVSRRRLLTAANLVMVPPVLSLLTAETSERLWHVYVVMFAYGTCGQLTQAAQSGVLRDLLSDEQLASGNATLTTIDRGLRLVSPVLGTALYTAAGVEAVVALTAACFGLTALLLARLELAESPPEARAERGSYRDEVTAGFRHIARQPVLVATCFALAVGVGAAGLVNVTIFSVMEQGLDVDPALLGVFVSCQGVGSVAGGLTAARLIGRLGERSTIAVGLALLAVGLVPLLASSVPGAVAGITVVGVGLPWVLVAFVTLRQRLTPPRLQGRVAAASNLALDLPQSLTIVLGALVIASVDYRLLITGSIAGLLAASTLVATLRSARVTSCV